MGSGTGPIASMYALRCLRGCASREVGRLVPISLPFGVLRTNLSRALTGTNLAGLRHQSKWSVFEACLRDRLTLHPSAERCEVSYRTAFLWRHWFLDHEQTGSNLEGIVKMDETYFLESCKGDRSLRERCLPRERGKNRGCWGLVSDQRPVSTAASRGGPTDAEALPSTAGAAIAPAMWNGGPKIACVSPMATPATTWQAVA